MNLQREVTEIIKQFESLKQQDLSEAVKYISRSPDAVKTVRDSLIAQPSNFYQALFQWLYSCAQLKTESNELYNFVLQFAPELIVIYLHGIYENNTQLKASSEALLMALLLETEKEKPVTQQVPKLSKPSIYHQSAVQVSQPVLTEAMLKRHDQTEAPSVRPSFSGKLVTVNNRLTFLSTVVEVFADRMIMYPVESQLAFCQSCIRLSLQGMHKLCISQVEFDDNCGVSEEELCGLRRYSVSDAFISSLLRGVRMCLFQSCHSLALKALQALRVRAEYELLTISMQMSHALARLADGVTPDDLQLDVAIHSSYHEQGQPSFSLDPSHIHTTLNGHLLFHNLTKESPNFQSSPYRSQDGKARCGVSQSELHPQRTSPSTTRTDHQQVEVTDVTASVSSQV